MSNEEQRLNERHITWVIDQLLHIVRLIRFFEIPRSTAYRLIERTAATSAERSALRSFIHYSTQRNRPNGHLARDFKRMDRLD
jgi:hypothetical protein